MRLVTSVIICFVVLVVWLVGMTSILRDSSRRRRRLDRLRRERTHRGPPDRGAA
ncbi:hypothetical protein NBM05_03505 [Rothia sp. AR01]|uniref:CcmD family protein n=1 Tax=Rothia santali TaxID=2949643 RepID=A0A9X2HG67_9MICC|nr:hypothetical protein [Rothia santali]MCP3425116.1 hypothetical protein [Rothia santali]